MAPTLRLVSDNGNPVPETWNDLRDNTLVTFTMAKEDVTGIWHGFRQVIDANAYLARAIDAAKDGDFAAVEAAIDRALVEMTYASTRARGVYERVRERAVRTNRRSPARKKGE